VRVCVCVCVCVVCCVLCVCVCVCVCTRVRKEMYKKEYATRVLKRQYLVRPAGGFLVLLRSLTHRRLPPPTGRQVCAAGTSVRARPQACRTGATG
jgi:hypothetical protein